MFRFDSDPAETTKNHDAHSIEPALHNQHWILEMRSAIMHLPPPATDASLRSNVKTGEG